MGYRWYNPALGRFWTRDPQGYAGGINLYAFVRNNPVMRADPLGLQDPADYEPPLSNAQGSYKPLMNTFHSGAKFSTKLLKGAAAVNPLAQMVEIGTGKRSTEVNEPVPPWERALGIGLFAITAGAVHINLPTSAYEVGTVDALRARSAGTGLEIHHLPQAHLAEQILPRYARETGLGIALPRAVHRGLPATSRLRGDFSAMTNSQARA